MDVTYDQVLAWRLRQQGLAPRISGTVEQIVERLAGVQAQVASSAELAITTRQRKPERGAVAKRLEARTVVKMWTVRGTLHLHGASHVGAYLSLVAAARTWEKPVWQRTFGVTPPQMEALGEAVDEVLDGRVLTRQELTAALIGREGFADLESQLTSGWSAVLKPLAWTGRICHGPTQGARVTFTSPRSWIPDWPGVPEPEEAARTVIPAYLRAHGPATPATFDAWLTRGVSRKAALRSWFASLGDELATVGVDGVEGSMMAADVDRLAHTRPSREVRLLAGFDQYVLGPGTGDVRIVAADRRKAVSRTAGWISPVVVHQGRVVGVWELADATVDVRLFPEADVPMGGLEAEVEHLVACTGQALSLALRST
ncbi:MAG: winged helix DNA-binding domain-containing protein [Acidimicrobiales bacterium]